MNVRDLMQTHPSTCRLDETLDGVTARMWSDDVGWLPVVDEDERLVGVVTDRDACMHAGTTGRALPELSVRGCMQPDVVRCSPDDALESALESMRSRQLQRLPVVDEEARVVGVLALGDVARAWRAETEASAREVLAEQGWQVLAAVRRPASEGDALIVPTRAGGKAADKPGQAAATGGAERPRTRPRARRSK